jgi:hypothetical protein
MTEIEITYDFKIVENTLRSFELVGKISKRLGIDPSIVIKILRANVLTPKQLAILSGKADSTIRNLMRPKAGAHGIEVVLTSVYPWRIGDDWGPVMILFDANCYDYLMGTFKPVE